MRSMNHLSRGRIGISILKLTIFYACLRQEKISSARFGPKLTIVLTNGWCDCVCGKRPITGLHCAGLSGNASVVAAVPAALFVSSQATRLPLQVSDSALDVERWTFDVSPEENETLSHHGRQPRNWSRNRRKARRQRCGVAS